MTSPAVRAEADRILRDELAVRLTAAHDAALRRVPDLYRRIIGEALAAEQGDTGKAAQLRAAQRALDRVARIGVVDFQDQAGRRWNMQSYVEMAVRTGALRARTAAQMAVYREQGLALVYVTNVAGQCELCRPWEGQVLAIDDLPTGPDGSADPSAPEPVVDDVADRRARQQRADEAAVRDAEAAREAAKRDAAAIVASAREAERAREAAERQAVKDAAKRAAKQEAEREAAAAEERARRLAAREEAAVRAAAERDRREQEARRVAAENAARARAAAEEAARQRAAADLRAAKQAAAARRAAEDAARRAAQERAAAEAAARRATEQREQAERRAAAQRAARAQAAAEREAAARRDQEQAAARRASAERAAAQKAAEEKAAAEREAARVAAEQAARRAVADREAAAALAEERRAAERDAAEKRAARARPAPAAALSGAAGSRERVDANVARVERAIADGLAPAVDSIGKSGSNPFRLSARDRQRLLGKLGGQAGRKVKAEIGAALDDLYPDMSDTDRDELLRSVMRSVTRQLDTPGRVVPGRGVRRAVAATERKAAFRASGADHRSAVAQARDAVGDPERFGQEDAIDQRDGGPSENVLAKLDAIRSAGAAISARVDDLMRDRPGGGTSAERAEARRQALAEVRAMGPRGDDALDIAFDGMGDPARERLERLFARAERSYPTSWITNNRARGTLRVTRRERGAWYNPGNHTMDAGTLDDDGKQEDAIVHELGHSMENANRWIKRAEQAYLRDRVSRGRPGSRTFDRPENVNTVTQEETYPDDFPAAYTGKSYGVSGSHEILTTAVESLMGPGGSKYTDADLEQFVLGMLAVL